MLHLAVSKDFKDIFWGKEQMVVFLPLAKRDSRDEASVFSHEDRMWRDIQAQVFWRWRLMFEM